MKGRFKIFSDPVHGFVSVPIGILMDLIQTQEVQRLRRVRQLGVGYLVFPGAEHSRFGHALGAMALMQDALHQISEKGTSVSSAEAEAAQIAALLHDVGHGPFSHTLESELITDFRHEQMSREILVHLNEQFAGALDLAIQIFDGHYERPFFNQLISSQLDMDRLDYLRRDAFYTGVSEGAVGVDRIIKTMRVHPEDGGPGSRVVIEAKGTYAVENFVIARRLMYWQVYLHKTVVSGDHVLLSALRRARRSVDEPDIRMTSPPLLFFLQNQLSAYDIVRREVREAYCSLDDSDVLFSLKIWMRASDTILADLSRRFVNRDFFALRFLDDWPDDGRVDEWKSKISRWLVAAGLSDRTRARHDATFYLAVAGSSHSAYEPRFDSIAIVEPDGRTRELTETTDTKAITALATTIVKPYVCYPKEVPLFD